MLLDLSAIRTDGGTQARVAIDENTVADYAEAMRAGATFPAAIVFYDGSEPATSTRQADLFAAAGAR